MTSLVALGVLGLAAPFLCLAVFPLASHKFESKHLVMAAPFLLLLAAGLGGALAASGERARGVRWAAMLLLGLASALLL